MFKTPNVIIPVRLDSSRLPAKAMLRLTSGSTVIEHCIARCLEFGLTPVVSTDKNSFQHLLKSEKIDFSTPEIRKNQFQPR